MCSYMDGCGHSILGTHLMYPEDYCAICNKLLTHFKVCNSERIDVMIQEYTKKRLHIIRTSWYHVKTGSKREKAFSTFSHVLALSMEKVLYFYVEMKAMSKSIPQLL